MGPTVSREGWFFRMTIEQKSLTTQALGFSVPAGWTASIRGEDLMALGVSTGEAVLAIAGVASQSAHALFAAEVTEFLRPDAARRKPADDDEDEDEEEDDDAEDEEEEEEEEEDDLDEDDEDEDEDDDDFDDDLDDDEDEDDEDDEDEDEEDDEYGDDDDDDYDDDEDDDFGGDDE